MDGGCPACEQLAIAYHEASHAIVDHSVWPPNPVVRITVIPIAEHDGVGESLPLPPSGSADHDNAWSAEGPGGEMRRVDPAACRGTVW